MSKRSKQFLSQARFEDLPIHRDTKRALREVFGYEHMSAPQALYLPVALTGRDVFVKAKTGSGKTLGFLVPAIERISRASRLAASRKNDSSHGPHPVRALVISPSRELADQTRKEALRLVTHHDDLGVQLVIGGTDPSSDRRRLTHEPCDILVATPGRLLDHVENLPGFADVLRRGVRVVIIDEADRLLDMGFLPALKRILQVLPPPGRRQALLFTATVPDGVKELARLVAPDYAYVDCSSSSDDDRPSHANIEQMALVVPVPTMMIILHGVLLRLRRATPDHRIIVFFTTARLAQFAAALFRRCRAFADTLELHSRLSQGQRTRTTNLFGAKRGLVLFASDVIARGIDFPDVTCVVQVGLTDLQQYEHRVGRTGRAGKSGAALLILGEDESKFYEALVAARTNIALRTAKETTNASMDVEEFVRSVLGAVPRDRDLSKLAAQAYSATLGFYASNMRRLGWKPDQVVRSVNARFLSMGLPEPPLLPMKTVKKMHLQGVPGLRVVEKQHDESE